MNWNEGVAFFFKFIVHHDAFRLCHALFLSLLRTKKKLNTRARTEKCEKRGTMKKNQWDGGWKDSLKSISFIFDLYIFKLFKDVDFL
jgi:hypothetical protein